MKNKLFFCLLTLFIFTTNQLNSACDDSEKPNVYKEWFQAARNGDLETVQKVSSQVDINTQEKYGRTALIWAACDGQEAITTFLLSLPGINVDLQDTDGNTALIAAVRQNNINIVKLLLQVPNINFNAQTNHFKYTALILATHFGHETIVEHLLQCPDINIVAQMNNGKTALSIAKESDRLRVARIGTAIKNKIEELDKKGSQAIKCGDLNTLKSVIAQIGYKIADSEGYTFLDKAFSANKPDIIFFLLGKVKDPRKLLARFPFEHMSPSTELFEYFVHLAYGQDYIGSPSGKYLQDRSQKPALTLKRCGLCSKEAALLCGKCKKTYYCCQSCQKSDWKKHKLICKI